MASRSVNKVILVGHLGKDAETKFTPSGAARTLFSVATNRRWKDQQTGEWKEETDWANIVLWRSEKLAEYLTRGKQVYVEGRLQTRNYDDKDGKKVYVTEVVADDVILLSGTGRGGDPGHAAPEEDYSQMASMPRSAAAQRPRPPRQPRPRRPVSRRSAVASATTTFRSRTNQNILASPCLGKSRTRVLIPTVGFGSGAAGLSGGVGWCQMKTRNAVQGIIGAFKSANLVALGERHWAREDSEFRLKLIRDPAFAQTVTDIAIEFANPLYQNLLDRHVNGEVVPSTDLRKSWQDTTQPGAWDSPVYEDFLHAVREVNAGLPKGRRVRVVAGDQPIDWSHSPETIFKDERDRSAASVIEREVLDRGRNALVLFGSAHIYRNRPGTIVDVLQRNPKAKWFVIVPVGGPDLPGAISGEKASPSSPELVLLGRGAVGDLYANDLLERGTKRVKLVDGKPLLVDGRPVFINEQVFYSNVKVRQVADACLYFGNALPEFVQPPPALYNGTPYGREVQRRRAIIAALH